MSTEPPVDNRWPAAEAPTAVLRTEAVVAPPPPPRPPSPERRFGLGMLVGLAALLLVAAGVLAAYLASHRGRTGTTTVVVTRPGAAATAALVPRVVGLQEQRALAQLAQAGLRPRTVSRPSGHVPAGTVLAQQPRAAARLARGASVTLVVAAGAPKVVVPTLTGMALADAKARLGALGLRSIETQVIASQRPGTVVDQAPPARTKVGRGAQITLSVAEALPVSVPDVTGEQQAAAESALRSAGLTPRVVVVASSQPAGEVTGQHPAAGTKAAKGSAVRVNVARGSTPAGAATTTTAAPATTGGATTTAAPTPAPASSTASVPDVSGAELEAAVHQLDDAGFPVSIQYVPGQDPLGTILQQSPAGGTTAQTRAHVTINASSGPGQKTPTTVPDLAGRTLPEAIAALHGAHLRLIFLKRRVTDRADAGKVVEQTPAAGKQAPPNAQVLVYLAAFRPAG